MNRARGMFPKSRQDKRKTRNTTIPFRMMFTTWKLDGDSPNRRKFRLKVKEVTGWKRPEEIISGNPG